jgi:hypothetical protein
VSGVGQAVSKIVLDWLPFWEKVLPEVIDAVRVLHANFADNPNGAIAKLREVKDHWANTDAQDADFKARIQAVADEDKAPAPEPEVTDQPVPEEEPDEPEALDEEAPPR